jgi:hypothetical protein
VGGVGGGECSELGLMGWGCRNGVAGRDRNSGKGISARFTCGLRSFLNIISCTTSLQVTTFTEMSWAPFRPCSIKSDVSFSAFVELARELKGAERKGEKEAERKVLMSTLRAVPKPRVRIDPTALRRASIRTSLMFI